MDPRGATERLKAWLVPSSCGGWVLTAFLLVVVLCAWAYSARDDLYKTYLGLQPGAQVVGKAAYVAGERLEMKKTASGARVTLNSVYAEEQYIVVGYEVENLQDGRQVAARHPAELQPLLGFGYGKPTPREKKRLEKYDLGTDIVALTDESGNKFRVVNGSQAASAGPDDMEGPLQNMVAFKPGQRLEPSEKHRFRLQVPLVEEAVVPMGEADTARVLSGQALRLRVRDPRAVRPRH